GPYWSILVRSGPYRFILLYTVHTGPFWSVPVYTGLYWSVLVRTGLYCFILVHTGLYWPELVRSGPYWSILVRSGPYRFTLVHTGPFWSVQVLSRCLALLSQLCSLRQLQAHLDEGRGRYLQAKGGATLLKSRLEELRVLLDTYPAPTVEAHRRIRWQRALIGLELAVGVANIAQLIDSWHAPRGAG
ncbi:PREDICTED: HAUS augmin-like complex subunit 4, partial [Ficedula albicollis]|uniref:HAUS augmin-like complex subunit 4 n=1 Tax=Ficedula albicollis TaxID=59894 RepID=UPI0007AD8386